MKLNPLKKREGFSLVELMMVVGIIGVLATLALPRFKQFQAKAKMGEAKNILSHIYTLEQTYSLDNNRYVSFPALGASRTSLTANDCAPNANAQRIGFRLDPCEPNAPVPRYRYAATANAGEFIATAATGARNFNRVCPSRTNAAHYFAINQENVIWGAAGNAPRNASQAPTGTEPSVGLVCRN
jgi:prepilin-type N-terminal cleavage/methylation domain-containing protein